MGRFVLLAVVLLSGCAAAELQRDQCAAPYEMGVRDGIMGLTPQDELYAPPCARNGVPLDLAAYHDGWIEGNFQYVTRTPHTE